MIRKANLNDLAAIEDAYNEHFQYEIDHQAYTVLKKAFILQERMPSVL